MSYVIVQASSAFHQFSKLELLPNPRGIGEKLIEMAAFFYNSHVFPQ